MPALWNSGTNLGPIVVHPQDPGDHMLVGVLFEAPRNDQEHNVRIVLVSLAHLSGCQNSLAMATAAPR